MFGRWKKKPEPEEVTNPRLEKDALSANQVKVRAEIGLTFARRLNDPDEDHAEQLAYTRRAIERCITDLAAIEDDFYHGFGAHMTIRLCVVAGELLTAQALYSGVREFGIRETILEEFPDLMVSSNDKP